MLAQPATFFLSTGRVGTTTLIKVLNLSCEISAHHEPHPQPLAQMPRSFANSPAPDAAFSRRFVRDRGPLITLAVKQNRHYVESTFYKYDAAAIAEIMPNATFIHVHRHPAEVVRSGMRRGWYMGHRNDRIRPRPSRGDPDRRHWKRWSAFEKNCWAWAAENRRYLDLSGCLDSNRVIRLSFEELFGGETAAIERLFRFVGVSAPPGHLTRRCMSTKTNQQTTCEFPTFERWSREMRETLDRLAGSVMRELGYEGPVEGCARSASPTPSTCQQTHLSAAAA